MGWVAEWIAGMAVVVWVVVVSVMMVGVAPAWTMDVVVVGAVVVVWVVVAVAVIVVVDWHCPFEGREWVGAVEAEIGGC